MMRQLVALALFVATVSLGGSAYAQTADLSADVEPIRRGSIVDAVITVTNSGPDAVFNVDVAIQYDAMAITATQYDDGCSNSSIGLTCSYSTLDEPLMEVGEELTIGVTFDTDTEDEEVIITVASPADDPNPGNDTTSFSVDIPESAADAGGGEADAGTGATDAGTPTEPADEGCCATTATRTSLPPLAFVVMCLLLGARRRRE
jgi:hypothetical protein